MQAEDFDKEADRLKKAGEALRRFAERVSRDRINVYAAQAAFYIITAFIPFLALLIILVKLFIGLDQTELTEMAAAFFPETLEGFFHTIIAELYSITPASVISLSTIIGLWSSSKGVLAVKVGLNRVYHTQGEQSYLRLRGSSIFHTFLMILVILFSLAVLVFGNSITSLLESKLPVLMSLINRILSFKALISTVLFTLFFALIYKYLPDGSRTRRFRAQLPGAFFASLGWTVFSYFYGMYIDNYSKYTVIYGSIGALVLMLLWIYFCLEVLLFGAEINEGIRLFRCRNDRKPEDGPLEEKT